MLLSCQGLIQVTSRVNLSSRHVKSLSRSQVKFMHNSTQSQVRYICFALRVNVDLAHYPKWAQSCFCFYSKPSHRSVQFQFVPSLCQVQFEFVLKFKFEAIRGLVCTKTQVSHQFNFSSQQNFKFSLELRPGFWFISSLVQVYLTCLLLKKKGKNHSTQDSRVVPHRGTN